MVRAPMMLTWLFKPIISYFRCLSKIRLNLLFYALLNYIHYISGAMFQLVRNSRYWLSYFYIPIAHPLGRSVIIFNRPKSTSTNFPMVIIKTNDKILLLHWIAQYWFTERAFGSSIGHDNNIPTMQSILVY